MNSMNQQSNKTMEEEIIQHQQKAKHIYAKIDGNIDRLLELYERAELSLKEGKHHHQIIEELNKQLLAFKPIKTVHQNFVHYYRKLSNLIRKLQSNISKTSNLANSKYSRRMKSQLGINSLINMVQQSSSKVYNNFLDHFINRPQEHEALQKLLVQHYLREGQWNCANAWKQMEKQLDPQQLYRECAKMREGILKGDVDLALKWCQTQKLYQTHETLLQYKLHLLNVLLSLSKKNYSDALHYLKQNMVKFHTHKMQEIQLLISHILFQSQIYWKDCIESQDQLNYPEFTTIISKRFTKFILSQQLLQSIANETTVQYFKHNNISKFDSLNVIYDCSKKISGEYMKMMNLVWQGQVKQSDKAETILPFSVKLQKQYQYHSLFLCPVTKEVHSSNDPSLLLACGHLISELAHARIIQQNRNRRRIKCPICQKQIDVNQSKNVQF